jgi:hypothetical protein
MLGMLKVKPKEAPTPLNWLAYKPIYQKDVEKGDSILKIF